MIRLTNKKIATALLLGTLFLSFVAPHITFAQNTPQAANTSVQKPDILDCAANLPTCLVYYASYAIDKFLGLIIAFGASVIQIGLNLTGNVVNSPTVQTGFSVSLALANLGFVIAIIVIALATILRSESYGVKQLLWKLIVMAILVNFGLVISGAIIGFSNNLSTLFMNATAGQNGFETNITNAFSPQSFFQAATGAAQTNAQKCNSLPTWQAFFSAVCYQAAFGLNGSNSADAFLQQTLSLMFSAVFLLIVAITFWAIAILLVVRYIWLGLLLVLLPLAWLMWIFPGLSKHFEEWWDHFIRWSFFPALALFFIYLAMQSVQNINGSITVTNALPPSGASQGPYVAAVMATGSVGSSLLQTALDEILLCGLVLGGLMAANSIGIKGAGVAIHYAKSAGNAVKGYVGKQGKKAARASFRAAGGQKAVDRMRTGRIPMVSKIPGLGWAANRAGSLAARAVQPHLDNKALVENAKKHVSDNTQNVKDALKGNMNMEDTLAHISKLMEKGELDGSVEVRGQKIADFMDKNEKVIKENYGQGKLIKDFDKVMMSTKNSRAANDAIKPEAETAAYQDALKKNKEAWQTTYNAEAANAFSGVRAETFNKERQKAKDAGKSDAEANAIAEANTKKQEEELWKYAHERASGIASQKAEEIAPKPHITATAKVANDIKDDKGEIVFKKGDEVNAEALRDAAMREFYNNTPKSDFSKANVNELFGAKAATEGLQELRDRLKDIAKYAPQIVPNLVKGMKPATLGNFTKEYPAALKEARDQFSGDMAKAMAANNEEAKIAAQMNLSRIKNAQEGFNRTIESVFGAREGDEDHGGHGGGGHGGGGGEAGAGGGAAH